MKKYQQYALRPGTGRTVPQAQVRVKASPSDEGSANATVYSDRDGNFELAQPFLASAAGLIEFYANDGRYDIYVDYEDISYVETDIDIYDYTGLLTQAAPQSGKYVTAAADAGLPSAIVIPSLLNHPDSLPAEPNGFNDEFSSLSGWTDLNFDANTSRSVANSLLTLTQNTTSPTAAIGLTKAISLYSDYVLWAHVRIGYHPGFITGTDMAGSRPFWGVGLRSNLGEIAAIGLRGSSQGISISQANFNSGGLVSADDLQLPVSNFTYVRIRKESSVWSFEWSHDGLAWITGKVLNPLFTGAIVEGGLYALADFTTSGSFTGLADYIRYAEITPE